eukprot:gene10480-2610_t
MEQQSIHGCFELISTLIINRMESMNERLFVMTTRLQALEDHIQKFTKRHSPTLTPMHSICDEEKFPTAVVFGSINVDLCADLTSFPKKNSNTPCILFEKKAGGKGANAAAALANLGIPTYIVGIVGNDELAQIPLRSLKHHRVDTTLVTVKYEPLLPSTVIHFTAIHDEFCRVQRSITGTGIGLIVSAKGEGKITVTNGAANADVGHREVASAKALLEQSCLSPVLVVQLETNLDAVQEIVLEAKQLGVKIMLKASPITESSNIGTIQEIARHVDFISVNEWEAPLLLAWKASRAPLKSVPQCYIAAKAIYVRRVNSHNDAYSIPTILVSTSFAFLCLENGEKVFLMPTFKDRVISIIGAADAATAGFIAAQLRGEKVETAVLWGATCASACIKKHGAQENLLTVDQVKNIISEKLVESSDCMGLQQESYNQCLVNLLSGNHKINSCDHELSNAQGMRVLHMACWICDCHWVSTLLLNNAPLHTRDRHGKTPLDYALQTITEFPECKKQADCIIKMLSLEYVLHFFDCRNVKEANLEYLEQVRKDFGCIFEVIDTYFKSTGFCPKLPELSQIQDDFSSCECLDLPCWAVMLIIEIILNCDETRSKPDHTIIKFIVERYSVIERDSMDYPVEWNQAVKLTQTHDHKKRTLLHAACFLGNEDFLKCVIALQAYSTYQSYTLHRPSLGLSSSMLKRVASSSSIESLSSTQSCDHGIVWDRFITKDDESLLHYAARSEVPHAIEKLFSICEITKSLDKSRLMVEVDRRNKHGQTVFDIARWKTAVKKSVYERTDIKQVFISYKHNVAEDIVKRGQDWRNEVEFHAKHADLVLFVVSKEYFQSEYCLAELKINSKCIGVIPPGISDLKFVLSLLPAHVSSEQLFDLQDEKSLEDNIGELLDFIKLKIKPLEYQTVFNEDDNLTPIGEHILIIDPLQGNFSNALASFLEREINDVDIIPERNSRAPFLDAHLKSRYCRAVLVILDLSRAPSFENNINNHYYFLELLKNKNVLLVPYQQSSITHGAYTFNISMNKFEGVVSFLEFISGEFSINTSLEAPRRNSISANEIL